MYRISIEIFMALDDRAATNQMYVRSIGLFISFLFENFIISDLVMTLDGGVR